MLVSDGAHAYRAFANQASLPHVALNLSAGERGWGMYHIQNVNNYGSRLKGWMRRFNGVATKYWTATLAGIAPTIAKETRSARAAMPRSLELNRNINHEQRQIIIISWEERVFQQVLR